MKTTSKRTKSLDQPTPTKKTKSKAVEGSQHEESKVPQVISEGRTIKNKFAKGEDFKLEKGKMHRIILWLRNDLRLHDNAVINWAANQQNKEVIPVYCFDPRFHQREVKTYGIRKCGLIRTKFELQSVANLRNNLEAIGSNLLVACQKPEDFLDSIVSADTETTVVYQQEICSEELGVEADVISRLKPKGCTFVSVWGNTLYHLEDLPFKPLEYYPHIYGAFRQKTAALKVRDLKPAPAKGDLPAAKQMNKIEQQAIKFLPDLTADFGFSKQEVLAKEDPRACYNFVGGEDAGLKRLEEYLFKTKSVQHYNDTRNQLIGANYSSKLSPWLANGSLSIKTVYHKTKEFESKFGANESTKVFIDELFWRDFNRFWCMHNGNKVFSAYGIYNRTYYSWKPDPKIVQRWRDGQTGMPLVDALMREMNATGFMPNRGRMVVACYFAMDLKQDWRSGAHYFEEKLIDHDVQSNYGGWSFSGGIGPGQVRVFSTTLQSTKFDPEGTYIRKWVTELANVPNDYIHDPWNMPAKIMQASGVRLVDEVSDEKGTYPKPIACEKYTSADAARKVKRSKSATKQGKLSFGKE